MSDQAPSKVFTWNNPASMTLRPCDIAEIGQLLAEGQKPTEVAVTLRRRSRKYRQVTRVGSGPIPVENYTIELLDEPTIDQGVAGGPLPELSQADVAEIQRLHALGVHRNRIAECFNIAVSELDAILPGSMPAPTPASQPEAAPSPPDQPFTLSRALAQRFEVVRNWTPPPGVEREIFLSSDRNRLRVELRSRCRTTRVFVPQNSPLGLLESRLDSAAAESLPQAQPSYTGHS